MKKIALNFLVLVFSFNLSSQDFAPIGAEWYYSEGFAFSGDEYFMHIVSEKDTLIQGIECHKLVKTGYLACSYRPIIEYVYSVDSIVYFWDNELNIFQILYNFNEQQNSSWLIKSKDWDETVDSINVTVDSTGIEIINEKPLKTLYVTYNVMDSASENNYSYHSKIIEKIGDISYLFNLFTASNLACDANYSEGLRCYEDPDFGFYSTGIADSCTYVYKWISIENPKSISEIGVYPNPTDGLINIQVSKVELLTIELRDISGKLLIHGKIGSNTKIDLSKYQDGLYFLLLKENNVIVGFKRIMKE